MLSDEKDFFAEEFKGLKLENKEIVGKDFDDCSFEDCDFSGISFKQCRFVGCSFKHCDMSLMQVLDTLFSDAKFVDCKIIGVDWTKANWDSLILRPIKFFTCLLDDSSFWGLKLSSVTIKECSVKNVDFREAVLEDANLKESDFTKAIFRNTNLQKADFTHATNFDIDIKINNLKGAKFSRYEAILLLRGLGIELVD